MFKYSGFSLIEVLISLLLVTTVSLALLKQHWRLSQFINQVLMRSLAVLQLDNQVECALARQAILAKKNNLHYQEIPTQQGKILLIAWNLGGDRGQLQVEVVPLREKR